MNKFTNHKFAAVPKEFQNQGIKWIRIIPEKTINGGVFMMEYTELSNPCLFDFWFENWEIAYKEAKRMRGIESNSWMSAEDIQKLGIEIIDEQ